jgi:hypothetical protein
MTLIELLTTLKHQTIALYSHEGKLVVKASAGVMTPDLWAAIQQEEAGLLAHLEAKRRHRDRIGMIDWREIRDRVCIEDVATRLLGPPAKREGANLLWHCPFHDDKHPSFKVNGKRGAWKCWACDIGGDAANLVMRINKCDFPAAVRSLADSSGAMVVTKHRQSRTATVMAPGDRNDRPSGLSPEEAQSLAREAVETLWSHQGKDALVYLHDRGLADETIREARLGFAPRVMIPRADGSGRYQFSGITIPWQDEGLLTRVKIRRFPHPERDPKYSQAFQDNPLVYPGPTAIQPGKPRL